MNQRKIGRYQVFYQIGRDILGELYLAREVVKGRPGPKKIAVFLHDYLKQDPECVGGLQEYISEITRSRIPGIVYPEALIREEEEAILILPWMEGVTLHQAIEGSERKGIPPKFETLMALVMKIAMIVDIGSMIILHDRQSFHGFLTPQNILIDWKGRIHLKYYGLLPFLSGRAFIQLKKSHRVWLTPELFLRGEILYKSEIYYLGHLVYRVLTGRFFPCPPGDHFEKHITNISFTHHLPSTDKEFITDLIEFFNLTLHPRVDRRFSGLPDLIDFIHSRFSISCENEGLGDGLSAFLRKVFPEHDEGGKEEDRTDTRPLDPKEMEEELARARISGPEEKTGRESGRRLGVVLPLLVILLLALGYLLILKSGSPPDPPATVETGKEDAGPERREEIIPSAPPLASPFEDAGETSGAKVSGVSAFSEEEKPAKTSERIVPSGFSPEEEGPSSISAEEKEQERETDGIQATEGESPPFSLDGVDVRPRRLSGSSLRLEGEEFLKYRDGYSSAIFRLLLDSSGRPVKVEPLSNLPGPLVREIVPLILQWRFSPARREGRRVKVWLPLSVVIQYGPPVPVSVGAEGTKAEEEKVPLVSLQEVDERPRRISGEEPIFSKAVRQTYRGRRATITARLEIDEKGRVVQVWINDSSLPADIADEVVAGLKTWRYSPPTCQGKGVRIWLSVTLKAHFK